MTTHTIHYSHQHGFSSAENSGLILPVLNRYESNWYLKGGLGTGRIHRARLRPGFDLWTADCLFNHTVEVVSEDGEASLSFFFFMSGASVATVGPRADIFALQGGQQGICYYPQSGGVNRVASSVPLRFVAIEVDLDRLAAGFDDDVSCMPESLRRIAEHRCNGVFRHIRGIAPGMTHALNQIMNCPYQGMGRKLYIEGRCLELIACQLDQFASPEGPTADGRTVIHPTDAKQTERARDLLVRDLENPPDLKALAQSAGMSHPKLNRCFRQVYGMTAFEYLRNERLHRAREMLEIQGLTVTETAYSVGYGSISHFSQAFKKQFGVSPGICGKLN